MGARVQAVRPISYDGLAPVPTGSVGTVVGPAIDEPLARIVVRWDSASPTGTPPEREAHSDDVRLMIAGGFRRGETVLAAKDLRVKGVVVVKQNVLGTVVGQSSTDPAGRVTVAFARREDGRSNNLQLGCATEAPCLCGRVLSIFKQPVRERPNACPKLLDESTDNVKPLSPTLLPRNVVPAEIQQLGQISPDFHFRVAHIMYKMHTYTYTCVHLKSPYTGSPAETESP